MEYSIIFDEPKSLIILKTKGGLDVKTYIPLMKELFSHPHWGEGHNLLVDHTESRVHTLSNTEVQEISNLVLSYAEEFGSIKMGIVISTEADYGMVRMWQILTEDSAAFQIMAFRRKEEALKWFEIQGSTLPKDTQI